MERTHLMIHCSETKEGRHFDKSDIISWHTDPKNRGGNGWSKPGYTGIWLLDGTLEILLPFDGDLVVESWEISNGARGWNSRTIHFCWIGGANNRDTRTEAQLVGMQNTVEILLTIWPDIQLIGHNQVNEHKDCPSFDVPTWAAAMGIDEKNIDRKIYY
jgi:N-acetylmuramoyl-L-alanine amidase